MRPRSIIIIGLALVLLQYLVVSGSSNAIIFPEMGLVILILARSKMNWQRILIGAISFGYVSDIIGATEKGSLIAAYLVAGTLLALISWRSATDTVLRMISITFVVFVVFHLTIALVGGPVAWPEWTATLIISFISASILVVVNAFAQSKWGLVGR